MPEESGLKKQLTLYQLVILGVSGSLGNGAIFGTIKMVGRAGSGAFISFLAAALIYGCIATVYMELSRVIPEAGGPTRYSLYSHGRFTNIINAFADLTYLIFIPPIEALSIVAGINYFFPHLMTNQGYPTMLGVLVGLGLLLGFVPFNYFGVGFFGKSTKYIGTIKIVLYVGVALGLTFSVANFNNFVGYHGFLPYGPMGILVAMPLAMYDFGGNRVIPDMAEEAKKPRKMITMALAITVLSETLIYMAVTAAVIAGTNWSGLGVTPGHYHDLQSATHGNNPFFVLTSSNHLTILFGLAVTVGIMAPFITGYIYTGSGTRVLLSMGRSGYVGEKMKDVDATYGIPLWSLLVFVAVATVVVLIASPVPSIYSLLYDATVATFVGFLTNPVGLMVLRKQGSIPEQAKIPGMTVIAPVATGLSADLMLWSGWPSEPYAVAVITVGVLIFGGIYKVKEQFLNSLWYIGFIIFITIMVTLSQQIGPGTLKLWGFHLKVGYIPMFWSTVITFVAAVAVFYPLGLKSGLKETYANPEHVDEI